MTTRTCTSTGTSILLLPILPTWRMFVACWSRARRGRGRAVVAYSSSPRAPSRRTRRLCSRPLRARRRGPPPGRRHVHHPPQTFQPRGDVVAAESLMRRDGKRRRCWPPDGGRVRALVDALCRAGLTEEATTTLARMRAGGCAPDVGTYGALMDGFTRARDWASAASLYAALERRGEDPDGRGWRLGGEGADRETQSSGTFDAVGRPRRNRTRMRAALAAACGRAGGAAAGAAAEAERLASSPRGRGGAAAEAASAGGAATRRRGRDPRKNHRAG